MQHVADALGLQKGSLYAHIGSKEELLFDVANDGGDRFLERAELALNLDATATQRLHALMAGHVETAIEHLDAASVFLTEWRYLSDAPRATIRSKRDRYEAIATTIVQDGITSGEFRADADVRFAVLLFLSAGNWVYEWVRPEGSLTPTEIGERFAELIVRGLQAPSTGGKRS